jgi:curved DNA-binding protein CbpA
MTNTVPFDLASIKDPYELLGVTPTATDKEITLAYRKKALQCHPDRIRSRSDTDKEIATLEFQQVGFVYAILKDPVKRLQVLSTNSSN